MVPAKRGDRDCGPGDPCGLGATTTGRPVVAAWTPEPKRGRGIQMLLALAVLLLVIAVVGGITIHPLLLLLALVAVLVFAGSRRTV